MIPVPMGIMAPAPTVSITVGMRGNKMESKKFIGSSIFILFHQNPYCEMKYLIFIAAMLIC